ncbi:hypothetical protein GCM10010282_12300 [Streptomyces roseolus]|nr:hypothetical protein GCM10010282_12300 [Streptomyces roseolus]
MSELCASATVLRDSVSAAVAVATPVEPTVPMSTESDSISLSDLRIHPPMIHNGAVNLAG